MIIRKMPSRKGKPAQEAPENHPRRGRARPLADDALSQASGALGHAGFSDPALVLRWDEIAGPEVARVASPLKLQEGPDGAILTLMSEAGAAVFLQHETRALIERLNAYLGTKRISRIRFVSAHLAQQPEPQPHPRLKSDGNKLASGLSGALQQLAGLRAKRTPNRGRTD